MIGRAFQRIRTQWTDWQRSRPIPTRWTVTFWFLAAGLFSIASVGGYLENHALATGATTTGIVVDRQQGKVTTLVLRFDVPDRGSVECSTDDFPAHLAVGDRTVVRYEREDPANNCAARSHTGYGGFLASLLVTAGLWARSVIVLRRFDAAE